MSENKKVVDNFYDYLFGVIKLHRETIPKLKDELLLIQSNSIDELNDNLNHQQLFLYQIKNFDEEVADFMNKLNLTGKKLSEVIQQLPEDEQMRFYDLLGQFEETSMEIQFYKGKCQNLLETKLHVVNKKIEQFKLKSDKTTYSEDGTEVENVTLLKAFEKSI